VALGAHEKFDSSPSTMNYRIQERKYSSNIIEKKVGKDKWTPYLAPLVKKEEGDELVLKLIEVLNGRN
jgi:hypothetical protein